MGDFDLTVAIGDHSLSPDERRAERVPADMTMSSTWQGGPRDFDCSLLRSASYDGGERIYDAVTVYSPFGEVPWCGRLQTLPRTVNAGLQRQTPKAQGWAVVGNDDRARRALFIDRDLGHLQSATLERRIDLMGLPFVPQDWAVKSGRLEAESSAGWTSNFGRQDFVARYDAGPLKVGRVGWQASNVGRGEDWVGHLAALGADGRFASLLVSDWFDAGLFTDRLYSIAPTSQLEIALYNNASTMSEGAKTTALGNLFFVGDHGLTLRGSGPADWGVLGSDAVRWLISTGWAGISPGDIVDSGVPIPHLAMLEPQSDAELFNAVNAFHGWAWGIWDERRRFDWHPYGSGRSRRWYISTDQPGVTMTQDGDDAAALFTRIVVTYRTAGGESVSVGPPGTIADEFDDSLQITDSTHPALARGVSPVYHLDLGQPATATFASYVGRMMLAQLNATRRAGNATIPGYARDDLGRWLPVYFIKGGDEIVWTDIGDGEPRRVVDASYNHGRKETRVTFDTQLQTVEAWLQHAGARVTRSAI